MATKYSIEWYRELFSGAFRLCLLQQLRFFELRFIPSVRFYSFTLHRIIRDCWIDSQRNRNLPCDNRFVVGKLEEDNSSDHRRSNMMTVCREDMSQRFNWKIRKRWRIIANDGLFWSAIRLGKTLTATLVRLSTLKYNSSNENCPLVRFMHIAQFHRSTAFDFSRVVLYTEATVDRKETHGLDLFFLVLMIVCGSQYSFLSDGFRGRTIIIDCADFKTYARRVGSRSH